MSLAARLKELNDSRNSKIAEARSILDKAEADKRDMNAEESARFEQAHKDADALRSQADRFRKQHELEESLKDSAGRVAGGQLSGGGDPCKPVALDPGELTYSVKPPGKPAQERRIAFPTGLLSRKDYREGFKNYLAYGEFPAGIRADLASGDNTKGGYTVAPVQMVAGLLKFLDDMVFVRQLATVTRVPSAKSLGIVSLDADPADSDWTTELATGSEDSTMKFGARELVPHACAKRLKVSNLLLRQSALDIEGLVNQRLGYKFGITEEKAFLTGSGAQRPLGVFTASAQGISIGRDISAGNATTYPTFDGLLAAKYALKAGYWAKASWIFHRDVLLKVAQLKDGNGQYIWQASKTVGEPDMLLGHPVYMSEYAPNTLTTGLYVGIIGDFSFYHIADALDMTVQRLIELYAETNQTGFIARKETDGMPTLEEAFARVKLA